ncbi:type I glutamate--ammonia ligase [bacterium]|nr:type I glutamate--ammonia ligase [bacterium]
MNIDQVIQFAQDNSVANIDIRFTNLFGGSHHITIPVQMLDKSLFVNGIGIDGSSIPGFKTENTSDMVLLPDPETAVLDPFWEKTTLSLIGSVFETDSKDAFKLDPRQICQKACNYLKSTGLADRSFWSPEFEFYIFDSIVLNNDVNASSSIITSLEAGFGSAAQGDIYTIEHESGYHKTPPNDRYFNIRDQMSSMLQDFGYPVKYHHHEVGGLGQSEIEIKLLPALKAGDAAMAMRYISKNIARQTGKCVTFMPKPLYNEAGNGMHFHQHLFNGDTPVFYDKDGYAGLSQTALHYIGGLLKHGPALLAITNPSTNSYKRLIPGFEAPVKAIFGLGNRSAAIRIPKYAKAPDRKRIEFRPPDGTCNVYLAIAAQLMAGIDGILNKIDPSEHGFGPYDIDITGLPKDQLDEIPGLPTSLYEALEALDSDHEFLFTGDVFSEDFIINWTKKLQSDLKEVSQRPHPYEMQLYFDA